MLVPTTSLEAVDACCTCASLLRDVPPTAPGSEKPLPDHRRLSCCGRTICGSCLHTNPRFAQYCPFCQTASSSLPPRLKSPPRNESLLDDDPPPPYSAGSAPVDFLPDSKPEHPAVQEDTLHFLDHELDSISSLSLRYGVPAPVLRRTNNLTSDHLLAARRTILIPASHYKGGVSLSPRPVEGEAEERRKHALRRFMVACKLADYDVAKLYLEQAEYDLELALDAFRADEAWEKAHPSRGKTKAAAPPSSSRGFWSR